MTDRRTGAFVETPVDTSQPAKAPDAPVSSTDVIGANWTLSRQDIPGAPQNAEDVAYAPLAAALMDKQQAGWLGYKDPSRYQTPVARGSVSRFKPIEIWEDIQRYRAQDPNFLRDVPAKNAEEFSAWVKAQEAGRRAKAQDVVRREQGLGQTALGFGTGVASSLQDPVNLIGMAFAGPASGAARSLVANMAREAVTNMAIETVELPFIASNRAQFGETMTPGDMVADVAMAGVAGAALPAAGRAASAIARPLIDAAGNAIAPAARAGQKALAPWALGRAGIENASDAEVARAFSDSVPFAERTPEAQAGLYVLDRQAEVQGASPYARTPGGLDANAEKLTAATEALSRPAAAGNIKPPPRTSSRAATPLTQDRVIRFVINDLEGGAKVVPYGDVDGGVTKFGIAKKFNPDVDVANLTEADAMRLARQRYWLPEFNTADPRVAAIAFDANYISSPKLARRIIREAGSDTEKAISLYREHLNHLADTMPAKAKYKRGWNNRVDKLARFVGENEAGAVRLAPEAFGGDDVAYRAQMEDLNREELRLADDTPTRGDAVRDYVDRLQSGDFPPEREAAAFEGANRAAIDAEVARRDAAGTLGAPDPLAMKSPPPIESGRPRAAETAMAVREYLRGGGDPVPESVARELDLSKEDASQALKVARAAIERDAARGLDSVVADAGEKGVRLDVSRSRGDVVVNLLDTTAGGRGRGLGTETMEALSAWADQSGVRLRLSPDTSFGATSKSRLTKFYKRFGFTENKGRSRDLSVTDAMLRDPKPAESVSLTNEPPPTAPPSLDPATYGIDTPTSTEAHLLADSAVHDVRALADAGNTTKFELEEGTPGITAKELIESLDRDQSAIDIIKACL